jgi:hypothetical protein
VTALLDGVFIQWYVDPQGVDMQKALESVVGGLVALAPQSPVQRAGTHKGRRKVKKALKALPASGR